jgi:phage-related tail fiber protein
MAMQPDSPVDKASLIHRLLWVAASVASLCGCSKSNNLAARRFSDGQVPVGTVVGFAGEIPPVGWLICDGRPLSQSDFPELASVLGQMYGDGRTVGGQRTGDFNIPDYRGRFLRGVDQGIEGPSGSDPDTLTRIASRGAVGNTGNHVGSYQADALAPPQMTSKKDLSAIGDGGEDHKAVILTVRNGVKETRPKNVNIYWIVRAK